MSKRIEIPFLFLLLLLLRALCHFETKLLIVESSSKLTFVSFSLENLEL